MASSRAVPKDVLRWIRAKINGCNIVYDEMGAGQLVVLTPGGRWGREYMRLLGERMASRYRVVIFDRRNCGASDVIISGEVSEAELWTDDLAQLIGYLGHGPAYIGEYAGCRTSLMLAVRHPEMVKGLTLAWPSGTPHATELLANMYSPFLEAVERGGMQAVVETPYFAARIAENPANRERLMAMDAGEFGRVVGNWRAIFARTKDNAVAGCVATDEEIATI